MDLNIFRIYFITILQILPLFADLQVSEITSNGVYLVLVSSENAKSMMIKNDVENLETDEAFHSCSMEQKCRFIVDSRMNGERFATSENIAFSSISRPHNTWMKVNPGRSLTQIKNSILIVAKCLTKSIHSRGQTYHNIIRIT